MHFQGDELGVFLHWCNCVYIIRRHVDSVPMTKTDTRCPITSNRITTPLLNALLTSTLIPISTSLLAFIPYGSWRQSTGKKQLQRGGEVLD